MRAVLAVKRTIAKRSLVDVRRRLVARERGLRRATARAEHRPSEADFADVVEVLKAFHAMANRARRVEGRVRRLSSTQEYERLEQAEPATRHHTPSAAR